MGSAPSTTFMSSFAGNSLVMDKQSMMVRNLLLGSELKEVGSSRYKNCSKASHHSSSGSSVGRISNISSLEASPIDLIEHVAPVKSISPPKRRDSEYSVSSSLTESMDSSKGRIKSIQSNTLLHSYEFWSHESIDFENCREENEMENIKMEIKKKKSPKHADTDSPNNHAHSSEHKKKKNNGWVEELPHHSHHSPSHHHSHHHREHHAHHSRHEHQASKSNPSPVLSPISTRHSHDASIHSKPAKLSPIHLESSNTTQQTSQTSQPSINPYNLPLIPFHLNLSASWDRQKAIELYEKSLRQHHESKSAHEFGS